ncbi:MAG: phage tail length tape measure family protein [Kiloniellales bacterium]|nr:phage tail length tape measure family protein [Kiloniellales bacterium]
MVDRVRREVGVRLSVEEADKFKRIMRSVGGDGQKAMREIQKATAPASRGLTNVNQASQGLLGSIRAIQGPLGPVAGRLTAFTSTLQNVNPLAVAAGAGIAGLAFSVTGLVRASERANVAQRQTVALLQTTERASGQTAASIEATARAIGRETLASTGDIRASANQLLTFRNISGEAFEETLERAQDLASLGFGSVQSQAVLLAKALEDPAEGLTRLRRIGVSFTASQQELIRSLAETGRLAEAQEEIFAVLERQVGGAAVAAAQGLSGAIDTLGEELGFFFENVGRASGINETLADGLNATSGAIRSINEELEKTDIEKLRDLQEARIGAPRGVAGRGGPGVVSASDRALAELRRSATQQRIAEEQALVQADLTQRRLADERLVDSITQPVRSIAAARSSDQIDKLRGALDSLAEAERRGLDVGRNYAETRALINAEIERLQKRLEGGEGDKLARLLERDNRVIEGLQRRLTAVSDPRQASIDTALARLSPEAPPEIRAQTERLAGQLFDEAKAARAAADALRAKQALEDEGTRFTESLATAQERHNLALREAKRLFDAGAISQETYNRAQVRARQELERTRFGVDDVTSALNRGLNQALRDGAVSWEEFGRIGISVLQQLVDGATSSSGILGSIFGGGFGGGGGGGGGSDPFSALFGNSSGLPSFGPGEFGAPRAGGGDVGPGRFHLVGERGRELLFSPRRGFVLPNDVTERVMGGGGAAPSVQIFNSGAPKEIAAASFDGRAMRIEMRDIAQEEAERAIDRNEQRLTAVAVSEVRRQNDLDQGFFGRRTR